MRSRASEYYLLRVRQERLGDRIPFRQSPAALRPQRRQGGGSDRQYKVIGGENPRVARGKAP